jgi:hypothetical protein
MGKTRLADSVLTVHAFFLCLCSEKDGAPLSARSAQAAAAAPVTPTRIPIRTLDQAVAELSNLQVHGFIRSMHGDFK